MQKYAKARSYKEYVNLPKKDRTRFGFWYLEPEMLPIGEWDAVKTHFKIEYPVQYRVREFLDEICYQWDRSKTWWHENILCRIKPKNKWATKIIPCTWADKTWLIETFLFECIVHYVEVEIKIYDHIDWQTTPRAKVWKRIQKCYTYITVELPSIKQQADRLMTEAYPPRSDWKPERVFTPKQREAQKKLKELENTIESTTSDILKEIVNLKDYLWT